MIVNISQEIIFAGAKSDVTTATTYTHWLMKSEPESRIEKGVDVKVWHHIYAVPFNYSFNHVIVFMEILRFLINYRYLKTVYILFLL